MLPAPQNTVAKYIATRSIIDLFLAAYRHLGTRVSKRWWEKELLELGGFGWIGRRNGGGDRLICDRIL